MLSAMSVPSRQLRVTLVGPPGERLDKALAASVPEALALSRSRLQALIEEGAVATDEGMVVDDPRARVAPGSELVISLPSPVPIAAAPEAIPLAIVFEDEHLIVIDKPAGLVVHPAPGAPSGTLVNALLHHAAGRLSGIGGRIRPGIVHRIDKDTSGLLVVAKTDAAHQGLQAQFKAHDLERRYLALVHGHPDPAEPRLRHLAGISWEAGGVLRIEGRIGRHPGDRKRMAVLSEDGKPAVTRARLLERLPGAAFVECRLETGRTHQIRVHMSFAGHPLVGDPVYGRRRGPGPLGAFPRQALHAASLGFAHPVTGAAMRFEAPLPADIEALLADLRRSSAIATFNET
jgi:23S rRNA pseudouridine1911/1915/1917 synthase